MSGRTIPMPSPQVPEPEENSEDSSLLSRPRLAVREIDGNRAALATPMRALAETSCCSANWISGRASSSAAGRPAGGSGGNGRWRRSPGANWRSRSPPARARTSASRTPSVCPTTSRVNGTWTGCATISDTGIGAGAGFCGTGAGEQPSAAAMKQAAKNRLEMTQDNWRLWLFDG